MADRVWRVRRDYKARNHSGVRKASQIAYFVIHTAEAPLPEKGAEAVGAYFQGTTSRGSTQYGVDVDSTQQYLGDKYVAWGAPPLNISGLHVECAGRASFGRATWLREYGPMFQRLGWLIAVKTAKYGIPLNILNVAELKKRSIAPGKGKGGLVYHSTVSLAYKQSDHTDPGDGFPMDLVMEYVRKYRNRRAGKGYGKTVLYLGCKGKKVRQAQNDLKELGFYVGKADGDFCKDTEAAVKKMQRKHGLKPTGFISDAEWRVLAS